MAVTVTDLRTLVSDANATTGWTGSNTVNLMTAEPTPVFGTGCLGMVVSNATQDIYFTSAARNLSAGVLVYVWVFPRGEMDTTLNGGLQILLGDGTNRIGFHVAGSDIAGFRHDQGPVGWQCLVLDTGNLPTAHTVRAGSRAALNLTSITQIGAVFKTLVKSVGGAVNCFIDAIRVGNEGIRVTAGTSGSPGLFSEIAAVDRANTHACGIIRQTGAGTYGVQGPMTFGGGATATWFQDSNASVTFEDRNLTTTKYFITVTGSGCTFRLGTKIGTGDEATGAGGVTFSAPPGVGAQFTATDPNDLRIYGSTISGFTNGVTFGSNTAHEFIGSAINTSGQTNPGSIVLRDVSFGGHVGNGAMRWVAGTNIRNSAFRGNQYGIEHPATGTFVYNNIDFAGNTFGVNNSSGGLVTIQVSGGTSPTFENTVVGSTTDVQNAVTLSITGLVDNTEVRIYRVSDDVELFGVENTLGGTVEYAYNYVADVPVYIHIHNINYVFIRLELTLGGQDASVPVQQRFDRNYSNPD